MTAPTTLPRRAAALVVLAALAITVAACSSSDDSGGTTTTAHAEGSSTTAAAAPQGKPLARYAGYQSHEYHKPAHWVCRPDHPDDICHSDLDATKVDADGTLTKEPFTPAKDPGFDCFYVYPTISRDQTPIADWNWSPDEEGFVTLQQAARLRADCRVFAPAYRQVSLSGLSGRIDDANRRTTIDFSKPFADVLDAFKTYMADDNHGRGIVLIGHSQGAGMLSQLLASEFDTHPDVRKLLVGAYLAGGAVGVPEGEVVGGDFAHIPLCTKEGEAGCITTWASFRSTSPPPADSFFGKPRDGKGVAGCVNPASVGNAPTDLDSYFPGDASASILSALGVSGAGKAWTDGSTGEITTPFVHLTDLTSGECTSQDGFNYLSVTVHPDPGPRADDISGDLSPQWGLHLVDVNLVMGDIVRTAADQAATWSAGR